MLLSCTEISVSLHQHSSLTQLFPPMSDQMASDWLRKMRKFSGPITE